MGPVRLEVGRRLLARLRRHRVSAGGIADLAADERIVGLLHAKRVSFSFTSSFRTMDLHRRPPPREELSDERARSLALADVLRMEDAKEHQQWEPPRRTTGRRAALAGLLFVVAVWIWVMPPAILAPTGPPQASAERIEGGLQLLVAFQVARIHAFRRAEGRLPDVLSETGEPLSGITYTRVNPGTFRIRARSGGQVVFYQSSDSLPVFMRGALEALRGENE